MIQVHSNFLEELSDYLAEQDDPDARMLLSQLNVYLDNSSAVKSYQDETMAFINAELTK